MVGDLVVPFRSVATAALEIVTALVGAAGLCALLIALPTRLKADEPAALSVKTSVERTATSHVQISLLFGNVEIGLPYADITDDGQLLGLDGASIIQALQPILVADRLEVLRRFIAANGSLDPSHFVDAGLRLDYSSADLALRVFVPVQLRTTQAISIAGHRPPYENVPITQAAKVSAYVNLRAADDYLSRDGAEGSGPPRQPVSLGLDGAAAILGMTLEGSANYREGDQEPWKRDDLRLIKDFTEDRDRLTLGDLNYGTTGFQSFQQAGGISIARNSGLQPYTVTSSTPDRTFTLERRSQVDVMVNGRRVRSIDLEPGRYNVRDLPLNPGTNDVALRIVDDVGRVETIQFPFIFDTNLLAPGEQQFSYALGALSRDTLTSKRYDNSEPVFSAFHSVGVTDALTLGANVQAVDRQQVAGAEARVGTTFGIFRGDLATSRSSYAPEDISGRLQYRVSEPSDEESLHRNLLANLTYRGKNFLPIETLIPSNPTSMDAGASYGQDLPFGFSGSFGSSIQFDSGGSPSGKSYDLTLSRSLTESLFLDLFGNIRKQRDADDTMSIFVSLSWVPFNSPQRVTYQYDSLDRSQRVDWSYSPPEFIDALSADISAERTPETDEEHLRGLVNFVDYRFEAQLRDDDLYGGQSTSARRDTGVRIGTALAFADGHFAISRPINDSFAMVVPHKSLAGRTVDVNPSSTKPLARADGLGPAIIPSVPSYYVDRVAVDVQDLPDGYDLGSSLYNIQPYYRSGTLIIVGTGATAAVQGIVTDGHNQPIDLRFGSATPIDPSNGEPKLFFTDAQGKFQIVGLAPGRYTVRLDGLPESAVIQVPTDATGIFDVGIVSLPIQDD